MTVPLELCLQIVENGFFDDARRKEEGGIASAESGHSMSLIPAGAVPASAIKNERVVVLEKGGYTTPSYAPPAWADCCNDGRHDGLHLIAASQFPAQIDKAFLGNCTVIHCG